MKEVYERLKISLYLYFPFDLLHKKQIKMVVIDVKDYAWIYLKSIYIPSNFIINSIIIKELKMN